jgi:transcriptional regulator with XRE-family HTH domain
MEIARKSASMKLAMRIRVARRYAKLSQVELAKKLGISRGAVANWESANDAHPAASRMVKLAVLTGVSVEWLVTGRGRMIHESDGRKCRQWTESLYMTSLNGDCWMGSDAVRHGRNH